MVQYLWDRKPLMQNGDLVEDYDYLIFGPGHDLGLSFGDELVRAILSYNIVESTQYDSISGYNVQQNLVLGFYYHPDPFTLIPQHPADPLTVPTVDARALYSGIVTPWEYHTFRSPTDPADILLYRTSGARDIESRTQHIFDGGGIPHLQVAIENTNVTAGGHTPVFFSWNAYVTTLWRKH